MLWRIYSFILATFLIAGYSVVPFRIWEFIDFTLSCTAFFGFSSYAFGVKVFRPWFWRLWLPVIILWDFTYNVFIPSPLPRENLSPLIGYLQFLPFILPEYLGLYFYAFKGRVITWGKN